MILSNIEKQYIQQAISHKLRIDGRSLFDYRKIKVVMLPDKGSLQLSLGQTKIFVKTKADIIVPKPDRPSEGLISFRVDTTIKGQESKKLSTQITKLFEKIIKGSNALDPESLCITTGKYVWSITVDAVLINDDGNIIDAMELGLVISMLDFKKPGLKIQKNKVEVNPKQKLQSLSMHHIPITFTFGLMKQGVFLDPLAKQQVAYEGRVSITINIYKQVCSVHKPGGISIESKTLNQLISVCELKVTEFTALVRNIVANRQQYE